MFSYYYEKCGKYLVPYDLQWGFTKTQATDLPTRSKGKRLPWLEKVLGRVYDEGDSPEGISEVHQVSKRLKVVPSNMYGEIYVDSYDMIVMNKLT